MTQIQSQLQWYKPRVTLWKQIEYYIVHWMKQILSYADLTAAVLRHLFNGHYILGLPLHTVVKILPLFQYWHQGGSKGCKQGQSWFYQSQYRQMSVPTLSPTDFLTCEMPFTCLWICAQDSLFMQHNQFNSCTRHVSVMVAILPPFVWLSFTSMKLGRGGVLFSPGGGYNTI